MQHAASVPTYVLCGDFLFIMLPDTACDSNIPAVPVSKTPCAGCGRSSVLLLPHQQVFPKSGWTAMFNAVKKSVAAGGPAYHLAEYTVMANPYQAVQGGWKVCTAAKAQLVVSSTACTAHVHVSDLARREGSALARSAHLSVRPPPVLTRATQDSDAVRTCAGGALLLAACMQ